jgi:hypothetical protein
VVVCARRLDLIAAPFTGTSGVLVRPAHGGFGRIPGDQALGVGSGLQLAEGAAQVPLRCQVRNRQ